MEIFEFRQNNSGGVFITNEKVCQQLFIEADNEEEAIYIAEELGCYWNGVENGRDCPCCGSRWSNYYVESTEFTSVEEVEKYVQSEADRYGGWTRPDARLFYKDGTVKEFLSSKEVRWIK